MAQDRAQESSGRLMNRSEEEPTPVFQFAAAAKSTTTRPLPKQALKAWDLSGAAAQFDRISNVRPLFGSLTTASLDSTQNVKQIEGTAKEPAEPSHKCRDLSSLKIPLADLPEASVLDEAKDDLTAVSQLKDAEDEQHLTKPTSFAARVSQFRQPTMSPHHRQCFQPRSREPSQNPLAHETPAAESSLDYRVVQALPAGACSNETRDAPMVTSIQKSPPRASARPEQTDVMTAQFDRRSTSRAPDICAKEPIGVQHQAGPQRTIPSKRNATSTHPPTSTPILPNLTHDWLNTEDWNDNSISVPSPVAKRRAHKALSRENSKSVTTGPTDRQSKSGTRVQSHQQSGHTATINGSRQRSTEQQRCQAKAKHTDDVSNHNNHTRASDHVPNVPVNVLATAFTRDEGQIQRPTDPARASPEAPEVQYLQAMTELRIKVVSLSRQVADQEKALCKVGAQRQDDRTRLEKTMSQLAEQRMRRESVEKAHEALEKKLTALKRAHTAAESTMDKFIQESTSIQHSLKDFGRDLVQVSAEVGETRQMASSAIDDFLGKADQTAQTMKLLKELQIARETESLRFSTLQSVCDRNAGTMSEDRDRISDLSKQVSALIEAKKVAEECNAAELYKRDQRINELSEELNTLRPRLEKEESDKYDRMSNSFADMKDKLVQQFMDSGGIREQLDEQRKLNKDLEVETLVKANQISTLNRETDALKAQLCQERQRTTDRQAEIDHLKDLISETKLEHEKSEMQREAKFIRCQQEWETTSAQEASRVLQECDKIRKESQDRKKRVDELELRSSNQCEELTALQMQLIQSEEEHTRIQARLKDDYDMERSLYQEQMLRLKEQDTMHFENQIKSQEAKLNRLEGQERAFNDLLQVKNKLDVDLEASRAEVNLLKDDAKALRELRTQRKDEANAAATLQKQNSDLRAKQKDHDELKKAHKSLERAHAESVATNSSLGDEVKELKKKIGVLERQAARPQVQTKASQPASQAPAIAKALPRARDVPKPSQLANLSRSSDSLSEIEDPTVYDFVGDTPPQNATTKASAAAATKKDKEKDKKRRSLPVDLIRDTQQEPDESFLPQSNVPGLGGGGGKVNQLRDERTTRSRSHGRAIGYKKRKSN